jgi:hypothetical protein
MILRHGEGLFFWVNLESAPASPRNTRQLFAIDAWGSCILLIIGTMALEKDTPEPRPIQRPESGHIV